MTGLDEIEITAARYDNGELHLATTSPAARRFVFNFVAGLYNIIKAKKKRSLDANAYAWLLIEKISRAVGITKETVYRSAICDVGAYSQLYIENQAVDDFIRVWSAKGLGWVALKMDERGDLTLVHAYYGSSVYDTKQMSLLIDNLVQDAQNMGIETLSERELSLLKEEWK